MRDTSPSRLDAAKRQHFHALQRFCFFNEGNLSLPEVCLFFAHGLEQMEAIAANIFFSCVWLVYLQYVEHPQHLDVHKHVAIKPRLVPFGRVKEDPGHFIQASLYTCVHLESP